MAGGEAFWQSLGTGIVETIAEGDNVTVDATDPANPIVSVPDSAVMDAGRWEVVVSGTAPPVATTNEAEDDWVFGWVTG